MKFERLVLISVIAVLLCVIMFAGRPEIAYDPIKFYNRTGQVFKPMKVFCDTITPSTSNGYSLDISAAGFTSITSITACADRNTATSTSVPNVAIKSMSTSAIVFNSTEGNGSLINVLGNNVLLGPSTAFSSTSGLRLHVMIMGY